MRHERDNKPTRRAIRDNHMRVLELIPVSLGRPAGGLPRQRADGVARADEAGKRCREEGLVDVPCPADLEDVSRARLVAIRSPGGTGVGFADPGLELLGHPLGGAVARGDHVAPVLVRLSTELGRDGVDQLG